MFASPSGFGVFVSACFGVFRCWSIIVAFRCVLFLLLLRPAVWVCELCLVYLACCLYVLACCFWLCWRPLRLLFLLLFIFCVVEVSVCLKSAVWMYSAFVLVGCIGI